MLTLNECLTDEEELDESFTATVAKLVEKNVLFASLRHPIGIVKRIKPSLS